MSPRRLIDQALRRQSLHLGDIASGQCRPGHLKIETGGRYVRHRGQSRRHKLREVDVADARPCFAEPLRHRALIVTN